MDHQPPPDGHLSLSSAEAWRLIAGVGRLLTATAEEQIASLLPPAGERGPETGLAQVIDLLPPSRRAGPGHDAAAATHGSTC